MHPERKVYQHFKRKKLQFPETRIWLWKSSNLCSNCKPFAWKMHLTLQKAAWEVKIASRGAIICKHWIISQYRCNNALGFELQCTKPAQGQKKQRFWTSKCTKPAQGQKNKKNNKSFTIYLGRGDYIPLKVLFFFVFLSLCRFGALQA